MTSQNTTTNQVIASIRNSRQRK